MWSTWDLTSKPTFAWSSRHYRSAAHSISTSPPSTPVYPVTPHTARIFMFDIHKQHKITFLHLQKPSSFTPNNRPPNSLILLAMAIFHSPPNESHLNTHKKKFILECVVFSFPVHLYSRMLSANSVYLYDAHCSPPAPSFGPGSGSYISFGPRTPQLHFHYRSLPSLFSFIVA